jgi:2-dehydropantoate 2-reductase
VSSLRITILGAGSIGLLFAAYFTANGHDVTLVTRTPKQKNKINKIGISLLKEERKTTYPLTVYCLEEYLLIQKEVTELLVVAVKQTQLVELESTLSKLIHDFENLLFIQNGMGHIPLIERLDHPSILLGVVEHGAQKHADNIVEHTGVGRTRIASFSGNIPESLAKIITVENFEVIIEVDWYVMLAKKLVVNAVINPLTALFNIKNGDLLKNQRLLIEMKALFDEAIDILGLHNQSDLWSLVLNVCKQTAKNTSSMLMDIQNKRPTEIDAISGYLLQRAAVSGKTIPNTEFVYNGIKGIEDSWKI